MSGGSRAPPPDYSATRQRNARPNITSRCNGGALKLFGEVWVALRDG